MRTSKFLLLAIAILLLLVGLTSCEFSNTLHWISVSLTPTPSFTPTYTLTATATSTSSKTTTATVTVTSTPLPTETPTETLKPTQTKVKNTPKPTQPPSSQNSGGCNGSNSQMEAAVLSLINAQRAGSGVGAVQSSSALVEIARNYSKSMAENGFFDHGNVSGRVNPSGAYSAVAEIIYAGPGSFNTADQALAHWLASPLHRGYMLDPVYTLVGVGYWCVPDSPYEGYFTVDFARP